jgi:hypothetical protein
MAEGHCRLWKSEFDAYFGDGSRYDDGWVLKVTTAYTLKDPFNDELSPTTRVYFVSTSECLNQQSTTPCSHGTLGTTVFDESRNFEFTVPHEYGSLWSLGRKICDSHFVNNDEMDKYALRNSKVYIYCPPCSCLIHTALSLCKELKLINHRWSAWVRPDDRLTASCCFEEDRSKWLEALADKSKEIEAHTDFKEYKESRVTYLDRKWIEQRVFEGEYEENVPLATRPSSLQGILENHPQDQAYVALLILGELAHSAHLMSSAPFLYKLMPPKETQIHKFEKKSAKTPWNPKFLGTYVPKNFVASGGTDRHFPDKNLVQMSFVSMHSPKSHERMAHGRKTVNSC